MCLVRYQVVLVADFIANNVGLGKAVFKVKALGTLHGGIGVQDHSGKILLFGMSKSVV